MSEEVICWKCKEAVSIDEAVEDESKLVNEKKQIIQITIKYLCWNCFEELMEEMVNKEE